MKKKRIQVPRLILINTKRFEIVCYSFFEKVARNKKMLRYFVIIFVTSDAARFRHLDVLSMTRTKTGDVKKL